MTCYFRTTSWSYLPTSYGHSLHRRLTVFGRHFAVFNKRPTSFDRRPTAFDKRLTAVNRRSMVHVSVQAAREGGACPYSFGLFPSGEGCTDYFVKCAYGEPQPELCTEGLAYDELTHSCNWPDLMKTCSVGDAERRWQHQLKSEFCRWQHFLCSVVQG